MANVLWEDIGDTQKAKGHHDESLKILETEPESIELASLYEDMAHMYHQRESMAKALTCAEKALELAKKFNDYGVIASSYSSLGEIIYSASGDWKKALECHEKALKIALDNGLIEAAIRAYDNLGMVLPWEEQERALDCFEKGFDLAKRVGAIRWVSSIGRVLMALYVGMGNTDKTLLLGEESIALDRRTRSMPNLSSSLNSLGLAYFILGEWDKAEQYYNEALNIAEKLELYLQVASSTYWLGILYVYKNEYAKAQGFVEKAAEKLQKAGAKHGQMLISTGLVWIYIETGKLREANDLLDNIEKFAIETSDRWLTAISEMLRGMYFRAQKKWEESLEHFGKSREYEYTYMKRWVVWHFAYWFLFEYARVYAERNQEGDREKARSLLIEALEILQKLGAKRETERIERTLMQIEAGQAPSEPKPAGYVATGYTHLDKLLLGGIPPNYAIVLTSPPWDERDLLIKSFLETGAKKGEATFYVSINPILAKALTEEFQPNFCLFVCNPQADAIVKDLPNVFKLKGVENLTEISIALTSAIHKLDPSQKGSRRICIDLVSDILLQHHAVQTRRWLAALIPELKSAGFTTLAVIDPRMHPSEELYAILGMFEGEINIYEKETEEALQKYLKIKKMSNQKYSDNELVLRREDLQKS
jgi:tetratricopeptide (TPR) repeat protein